MKKNILFVVSALALLCGCKHDKASVGDKPVLMVSIEPQRKLLEAVAGPGFEVATIMPVGTNPETFEPSVAQKVKAAYAEAYFPIGYLPFESVMEEEMKERSLRTTSSIRPLIGTHSHGEDDRMTPDPHLWSSVRNCIDMVGEMERHLRKLYPEQKEDFSRRADSLVSVLDALDKAIADTLSGASRAFMVWHPSLSYFARDYGLEQIAVGHESKEASMGQLASLIQEAKADSVRVFFFQKELDSRQAESLSNEIGARMVEIDPLAYDWDVELMKVANELAKR